MIAYLVDLGILPQVRPGGTGGYVPVRAGYRESEVRCPQDNDAAALDASTSLAALTTDLADSTNPIAVDFGSYLPTMAADLANYFQSLASSL